jgi:hypothetical protein
MENGGMHMDRKSISLEWVAAAGTVLLVAAVMVLDSRQAKKEPQPAVQAQATAMQHEPVAMADAAARLALEQVQQPVKP